MTTDFIQWLVTLSPDKLVIAILATWLWMERSERKEILQARDEREDKRDQVLREVGDALKDLTSMLKGRGRR